MTTGKGQSMKLFISLAFAVALLATEGAVNRNGYSSESNVIALAVASRSVNPSSPSGLEARFRTWANSLGSALRSTASELKFLLFIR